MTTNDDYDFQLNVLDQFYEKSLRTFTFKERTERLDLKPIINIDLSHVEHSTDISKLKDVLQNITFCSIREEDLRFIPNKHSFKLFRTTQLIMEYFIHVHQQFESLAERLGSSAQSLKKTLLAKQQEISKLEAALALSRASLKLHSERLFAMEAVVQKSSVRADLREQVDVHKKIQYNISGPEGCFFEYTGAGSTRVGDIKRVVKRELIALRKVQIPPGADSSSLHVNILYRGRSLSDDSTLGGVGLQNTDSTLVLTVERPISKLPIGRRSDTSFRPARSQVQPLEGMEGERTDVDSRDALLRPAKGATSPKMNHVLKSHTRLRRMLPKGRVSPLGLASPDSKSIGKEISPSIDWKQDAEGEWGPLTQSQSPLDGSPSRVNICFPVLYNDVLKKRGKGVLNVAVSKDSLREPLIVTLRNAVAKSLSLPITKVGFVLQGESVTFGKGVPKHLTAAMARTLAITGKLTIETSYGHALSDAQLDVLVKHWQHAKRSGLKRTALTNSLPAAMTLKETGKQFFDISDGSTDLDEYISPPMLEPAQLDNLQLLFDSMMFGGGSATNLEEQLNELKSVASALPAGLVRSLNDVEMKMKEDKLSLEEEQIKLQLIRSQLAKEKESLDAQLQRVANERERLRQEEQGLENERLSMRLQARRLLEMKVDVEARLLMSPAVPGHYQSVNDPFASHISDARTARNNPRETFAEVDHPPYDELMPHEEEAHSRKRTRHGHVDVPDRSNDEMHSTLAPGERISEMETFTAYDRPPPVEFTRPPEETHTKETTSYGHAECSDRGNDEKHITSLSEKTSPRWLPKYLGRFLCNNQRDGTQSAIEQPELVPGQSDTPGPEPDDVAAAAAATVAAAATAATTTTDSERQGQGQGQFDSGHTPGAHGGDSDGNPGAAAVVEVEVEVPGECRGESEHGAAGGDDPVRRETPEEPEPLSGNPHIITSETGPDNKKKSLLRRMFSMIRPKTGSKNSDADKPLNSTGTTMTMGVIEPSQNDVNDMVVSEDRREPEQAVHHVI